jgi:hypothetical protein
MPEAGARLGREAGSRDWVARLRLGRGMVGEWSGSGWPWRERGRSLRS